MWDFSFYIKNCFLYIIFLQSNIPEDKKSQIILTLFLSFPELPSMEFQSV